MAKREHRGRIQAQGNGLEASESWAQDEPLTAQKGLELLNSMSGFDSIILLDLFWLNHIGHG